VHLSTTTLEMDAPVQKASNGQCETDRFIGNYIVIVLLQTVYSIIGMLLLWDCPCDLS